MQIREHAEATPDRPAVILHPSGEQVSFAELEARANRLAHRFRRAGLVEGDAVAVLMENNEHLHSAKTAESAAQKSPKANRNTRSIAVEHDSEIRCRLGRLDRALDLCQRGRSVPNN